MVKENTLLHRLKLMDDQALVEVYDTFNHEIYRYAWGLLGDTDLAEECVAETFSRFLLALSNGGGPRQYLRAYLYRIAHNWICDFHRRQPISELPLDDDLIVELVVQSKTSSNTDPASANVDILEQQRLRLAITRLTPDQMQVISMKYLANLENEEIAQTLNKPIGAVKSLQIRALAALRKMLPEDQNTKNILEDQNK
jgi:RNA polymerase sigma-70 factor, ECF subfamily